LAALEAMACGAPVVASRVGGLPEVVQDGVTGALCPMGDVDAMAAAAIALLSSPDKLRAARVASVARAGEFSTDVIVPQYEALYRRILSS